MVVMMTEAEALEEFRTHMVGQRSNDASVIEVRYDYSINADAEEYLLVELVLADPPPGVLFWPHRDVHELQRRGEVEMQRLRIAPPYFVDFTYLSKPGELEDDDEAEVDR
jgi:hypothetical protein